MVVGGEGFMSASSAHSLASLKAIKNGIIGNTSRKAELAREGSIPSIVENLKSINETGTSGPATEILTDSAHIISSLSFGCPESLKPLVDCNTHHVLLHALSDVRGSNSNSLISAIVRAFRAFCTSVADVVGPPMWGFQVHTYPDMRLEASSVLEEIFQLPSLDIWLPFLLHPSSQVNLAIAWIVSLCTRNPRHRDSVTQWLPPGERAKETKGKRGWERPDVGNVNSPSRGGGWLVRNLQDLLKNRDVKVQEAALYALAALFKDSQATVMAVRKPPAEGDALLFILSFSRSRNVDVQLAACYCATHMLRAYPPSPLVSHGGLPTYDGSPALTVIHVLNIIIGSGSVPTTAKARACYILTAFVRDETEIEKIAVDVGSLEKVTALLLAITFCDKAEWDDDEAEGTARLRESVLMATSALTLHGDGIRRDLSSQPFFSCVHVCMSHPHPAVRHAACQCARVLCRSISVLRTSVVDSGIGLTLFELVQNLGEDTRIKVAALTAICNLVNDYSPVRVVLLHRGVISTFVEFLNSDDHSLRLNAMWAIKNTLFHATLRDKCAIMEELGWGTLYKVLGDCNEEIQEQAVAALRNLSDNDPDLVLKGLGTTSLISSLELALRSCKEVVIEGLYAIANLANGTDDSLDHLLSSPAILEGIHSSLEHVDIEVRRAAALCVWKLARRIPHVLQEVGIEGTLRRMVEGPTPTPQSDDREVIDRVRRALVAFDTRMDT